VIVITHLHRQIAQAVAAGHDIDEIELNIIEPTALSEDEKSALWLYAQALTERPRLERSPERMLAPLGSS
jgi:hypothetical protein